MAVLEDALAQYIQLKMPEVAQVRVDQLEQISGGASRQTCRFRVSYSVSGII